MRPLGAGEARAVFFMIKPQPMRAGCGVRGLPGDSVNNYKSGGVVDETYCSFCGAELKTGENAYGLTAGTIDKDCCGFRMDLDDAWDIYCPDCMNQIDRLIAAHKQKG